MSDQYNLEKATQEKFNQAVAKYTAAADKAFTDHLNSLLPHDRETLLKSNDNPAIIIQSVIANISMNDEEAGEKLMDAENAVRETVKKDEALKAFASKDWKTFYAMQKSPHLRALQIAKGTWRNRAHATQNPEDSDIIMIGTTSAIYPESTKRVGTKPLTDEQCQQSLAKLMQQQADDEEVGDAYRDCQAAWASSLTDTIKQAQFLNLFLYQSDDGSGLTPEAIARLAVITDPAEQERLLKFAEILSDTLEFTIKPAHPQQNNKESKQAHQEHATKTREVISTALTEGATMKRLTAAIEKIEDPKVREIALIAVDWYNASPEENLDQIIDLMNARDELLKHLESKYETPTPKKIQDFYDTVNSMRKPSKAKTTGWLGADDQRLREVFAVKLQKEGYKLPSTDSDWHAARIFDDQTNTRQYNTEQWVDLLTNKSFGTSRQITSREDQSGIVFDTPTKHKARHLAAALNPIEQRAGATPPLVVDAMEVSNAALQCTNKTTIARLDQVAKHGGSIPGDKTTTQKIRSRMKTLSRQLKKTQKHITLVDNHLRENRYEHATDGSSYQQKLLNQAVKKLKQRFVANHDIVNALRQINASNNPLKPTQIPLGNIAKALKANKVPARNIVKALKQNNVRNDKVKAALNTALFPDIDSAKAMHANKLPLPEAFAPQVKQILAQAIHHKSMSYTALVKQQKAHNVETPAIVTALIDADVPPKEIIKAFKGNMTELNSIAIPKLVDRAHRLNDVAKALHANKVQHTDLADDTNEDLKILLHLHELRRKGTSYVNCANIIKSAGENQAPMALHKALNNYGVSQHEQKKIALSKHYDTNVNHNINQAKNHHSLPDIVRDLKNKKIRSVSVTDPNHAQIKHALMAHELRIGPHFYSFKKVVETLKTKHGLKAQQIADALYNDGISPKEIRKALLANDFSPKDFTIGVQQHAAEQADPLEIKQANSGNNHVPPPKPKVAEKYSGPQTSRKTRSDRLKKPSATSSSKNPSKRQ